MSERINFDALIQSIQDAFIKVNDMSEAQHVNKLAEYFEEDGTPKTFTMQYPYFDEDGVQAYRFLSVPQICLVPISSLKLDEIEIDFKVQIYGEIPLIEEEAEDEEDDFEGQSSRNKKQKRFKRSILSRMPQGKTHEGEEDNYAAVRLKFTSQEPPEGLMRIKDQFVKVTL